MKQPHLIILLAAALLAACGQTEDEARSISRAEQLRLAKEDSAALKVAVMPTLDCLPLYVAEMYNLFDTLGADVRLKAYTAQMDCDTALERGHVEGAVTDLVRGQRMAANGTPLTYATATNAYWQLITTRNARLTQLKQLDDKMVAMARHSATALLADEAVARGGLQPERVFRIQVNDVNVRLQMLLNNSMDATLLTEPQATAARNAGHRTLLDSRTMDTRLGAIAFSSEAIKAPTRQRQMETFIKAYNMACDSINKNGPAAYRRLIAARCGVGEAAADSLPRNLKFAHAAKPRQKDIETADKWLEKTRKEENHAE